MLLPPLASVVCESHPVIIDTMPLGATPDFRASQGLQRFAEKMSWFDEGIPLAIIVPRATGAASSAPPTAGKTTTLPRTALYALTCRGAIHRARSGTPAIAWRTEAR